MEISIIKIEGVETNLVVQLSRVVLVMVKSEDFSKVRELLETEKIEFFVNDPMLGVVSISGVKAVKLL